jgi:hypothetical protein
VSLRPFVRPLGRSATPRAPNGPASLAGTVMPAFAGTRQGTQRAPRSSSPPRGARSPDAGKARRHPIPRSTAARSPRDRDGKLPPIRPLRPPSDKAPSPCRRTTDREGRPESSRYCPREPSALRLRGRPVADVEERGGKDYQERRHDEARPCHQQAPPAGPASRPEPGLCGSRARWSWGRV